MPFKSSVELRDLRVGRAATFATFATLSSEERIRRQREAECSTNVELRKDAWAPFCDGGNAPPMIAPNVPDWRAFCKNYPNCDEVNCLHYEPEKDCWCRRWEECFPGMVRWYSWADVRHGVNR